MTNTHRNEFERSARTKLAAAEQLVAAKGRHPGPAAYLIHVVLECALKVRILVTQNAKRTEELRNSCGIDEATFAGLFSGRTGHDLHHLANVARLNRFLVAKDRGSLLDSDEWKAMAGDRPYSLRYGTESVSDPEARKQVELARQLTSLILDQP
jgi:hypothetical protein